MKRFFLFLLMAVPAIGIAQSNFQKGYLVTNTGDTLRGYIDYREGLKTPASFVFKTELNSAAPKTYTLKDCTACHIDDMASYQRFLVNISLGSVELSKISALVDTTSRRDTVFLQVLQSGPNVTLYSYVDRIKTRFYILDKAETFPEELVMQLYYRDDESGKLLTNLRYARQLSVLMKKYEKLTLPNEHRLGTLKYKEDELIKVAALINGQQKPKSKYKQFRWFAGLSLDMANTKFRGETPLASSDATSKIAFSPMFSGGVDLFVNPAIRRLLFRIEMAFVKSNSEVTSPAGGNSFDQLSMIFSPSILYHIYNADKLKVFVSVGSGLNYSKVSNLVNFRYEKEILTDDRRKVGVPLDLEKFYLTIPINAGVVLNKRIELLAGYSVPTAMSSYAYYSVERQRFRVGLNYLFGKH
ncbi:outer membrane beta-barrel protein [Pedobacter sp. N36a]|uniref:outer membrane beta-barrel protein n=1 Tax=Pedobacter sp. N36a TaxID=2767996 RepID=UPI0016574C9B|nr:outer membrane beta-barrel protein [Pedobacter sp. N36a]MBC8985879.1 outer membrane beta-barrel protein [Pedobacter sp. N36a]